MLASLAQLILERLRKLCSSHPWTPKRFQFKSRVIHGSKNFLYFVIHHVSVIKKEEALKFQIKARLHRTNLKAPFTLISSFHRRHELPVRCERGDFVAG